MSIVLGLWEFFGVGKVTNKFKGLQLLEVRE